MIAPDTTTPRPVSTASGSFVTLPADRTALVLLAVVSAALQLPFLRRGISFYDEGSILAIADALHRGEVLYRDRATPTAPLTYELLAGLFDLFGPHLLVGRFLQAAVFVLCVLAVYVILRHFMGVHAACLGALALLPLKTLAFPFWTVVNYSQLAMLFWLATTAALLRYLSADRGWWALVAGCGIGLTVVTKQNLGGALAVACAGTLFLDAVRRDDGRLRSLLVGSAALVGCSLLPVLGFGTYYASCGSLDAVMARAVVGLLHLVQPYGVPLPWRYGSTDVGHLIFTYFPTPLAHLSWQGRLNVFTPWFFQPVGHLVKVVYFGPVLALTLESMRVGTGWWRGEPRRAWSGRVLIVALGAAAYASMLYRADWTHLMNVAPPLLLVCVVLVHRLTVCRRSGQWVVGALWALWMALGGLAGWAVVAVYQVPVQTPRGDLLVPRAEAEDTERVLAYLASRPATERILVLRAEPLYYFLSGRTIPGEFDLVMPGLLGRDDDRQIARDLPAVDVIVYNPKQFITVPSPITEYAPDTARAMVTHFEPSKALCPTAMVFSRRPAGTRTVETVRELWSAPQEGTAPPERTSWMTYHVLARTVTVRGVARCIDIRHDAGPNEGLLVTPMLDPVTWVERLTEADRVRDAAPAVFRIVAVTPDGRAETLFTERRRPGLPGPAVMVPLDRYAGVPILLRLCMSLPEDLPPGPATAPAGWAEPQIVRNAAPD